MYKAEIHLPKVTITVEAENVIDLWDETSAVAEVFGESACGECGCEAIKPVSRPAEKGKLTFIYREWVCTRCGAKLNLGQQEGGKLFPKRLLKPNGAPIDYRLKEKGERVNNGWTKYRGPLSDEPEEEDDAPASAPASQSRANRR